MTKSSDYKHIALWGTMMGSFPEYISGQQDEAAEDNAPLDAIYKREGKWEVFSEVTNADTLEYFAQRGLKQEGKG